MSLTKLLNQKLFQVAFCAGVVMLSGLSMSAPLHAIPEQCHCHDGDLGFQLETKFWRAVQKQNVNKYSKMLAGIFQGLSLNGSFNKQEQVAGLSSIIVTSFSIRNPKTERAGNVLTFTYDFLATGSGVVSGPSLSVWKKTNNGWKMVSHSYVPFLE